MDFIKKNRTLKIFLVILVILNLGILGSFWFIQQHKHTLPNREEPKHFLIRKVGFDEAQTSQYKGMVEQHHHQSEELRKRIHQRRKELYNYREPSDKEILLDEITRLKRDNEKILYEHFAEVRQLCNSDKQRELFDNMLLEMLRKMQAPGSPKQTPGGPHPPHH